MCAVMCVTCPLITEVKVIECRIPNIRFISVLISYAKHLFSEKTYQPLNILSRVLVAVDEFWIRLLDLLHLFTTRDYR
jgi:hypothetical protein